ncbi:ICE-like protease (caspase) p20 domain protein [Ceratobasidium sp. AG-Ba]|nr:ICE-like protease (caspase) p20 domain protein [Ceratobasidium sp. AG-Ba]
MKLENEKDAIAIAKWAGCIRSAVIGERLQVDTKTMRGILRYCGKEAPVILYIGGHTMNTPQGKIYLPADCCIDGENIPSRGIAFTDMRKMLFQKDKIQPMLLVTDACDFTNPLELPFVLRLDGKRGRWEKTEYYLEGNPKVKQSVLHFASTKPAGLSYSFKFGGIFTREFCNVGLDEGLTLTERSAKIQECIDKYMREYQAMNGGELLSQQHQDLNEKNPFAAFGLSYIPSQDLETPHIEGC